MTFSQSCRVNQETELSVIGWFGRFKKHSSKKEITVKREEISFISLKY